METKEITVYKAVQLGYTSAVVRGKAQVDYKPRIWAVAPVWLANRGYHITCFRTLEQAKNFAKNETRTRSEMKKAFLVWVCLGRGVISGLPKFLNMDFLEIGELRAYSSYSEWPPGTLMVKGLRLGYPLGIYHNGRWYPKEGL